MAKNDLRGVAVDELTPPDAAVELEILAAEIAAADAAYYQDDAPSLSDAGLMMLCVNAMKRLRRYSPSLFEKIAHQSVSVPVLPPALEKFSIACRCYP